MLVPSAASAVGQGQGVVAPLPNYYTSVAGSCVKSQIFVEMGGDLLEGLFT
jgi:hypothetical protein